ncbi:MAG TPA: DUF2630 family protein [Acidimicrobiales bacterium]|nr:DUF2630 family protein [Acidimicrobiales bacterium]
MPSEEAELDDADIVRRIGRLAEEEHNLERSFEGKEPSSVELERLRQLEVTLDQCWDLLRRRRARRNAGQDPDDVTVRPESVVESYRQ